MSWSDNANLILCPDCNSVDVYRVNSIWTSTFINTDVERDPPAHGDTEYFCDECGTDNFHPADSAYTYGEIGRALNATMRFGVVCGHDYANYGDRGRTEMCVLCHRVRDCGEGAS